jgi:hypothetical protein
MVSLPIFCCNAYRCGYGWQDDEWCKREQRDRSLIQADVFGIAVKSGRKVQNPSYKFFHNHRILHWPSTRPTPNFTVKTSAYLPCIREIPDFNLGSEAAILGLFLYFLIGGGYPETIPAFPHRRRLPWDYSCISSEAATLRLFLYFIGGGYPEAIPVFPHRRRLSWGYSCTSSSEAAILRLYLYFLIGTGSPKAIHKFPHRRWLSWGYSCISS